ncbi:MAG: hypothetical protein UZ07_CHB004000268 [Chlorobi bacterium OLB7]|nr:MAG: hypothetical protein UZ07_CHB004000268 [Chlorobi bacterium OLB7]
MGVQSPGGLVSTSRRAPQSAGGPNGGIQSPRAQRLRTDAAAQVQEGFHRLDSQALPAPRDAQPRWSGAWQPGSARLGRTHPPCRCQAPPVLSAVRPPQARTVCEAAIHPCQIHHRLNDPGNHKPPGELLRRGLGIDMRPPPVVDYTPNKTFETFDGAVAGRACFRSAVSMALSFLLVTRMSR